MRSCVIIPTYNEAASIRDVVERTLATVPTADVLIVDDASPDGTGAIGDELAAAEPRVRILHRGSKQGLGPAYLAGFADALARDYEAIVEMDADLSHDPADVARMLDAAATADVVVGSRWIAGGDTRNWTRTRIALSRAGNSYARGFLGLPVRDATSGFRLYRRAVLEELPLDEIRSEGYAFQVEMLWRAWLAGFAIVEIPIVFVERRAGASKMSRAIVAEAVASIARWGTQRNRPPGEPHPRSVRAR